MEVKRVLQLQVVVVVFLLAGLNGARAAVVDKYFMEGGNLVLQPNLVTTIRNILWKHKGNLVAEWVQGAVNLTYYDTFVDRTTLSQTTGQLLITKMTKDDAGGYTLEINSKVHGESYNAKVIKGVPKPSVWIQPVACTDKNVNCTLLCDGRTPEGTPEDTTEAEPITYSWRRDEGEWRVSKEGNELKIVKNGMSHIKTFSCRMENPVTMKESQPKDNPFFTEETETSVVGPVVGSLVGAAALGVVVFLGYRKKDAIKALFSPDAANDNPNVNGNPKSDDVTVPLHESPTEQSAKTED